MAFLSSLDIPLSGMIAERFRLDIIGQNVNNAVTTRTEDGTPYVRQCVVFTEQNHFDNIDIRDYVKRRSSDLPEGSTGFGSVLEMTLGERRKLTGDGVAVTEVVEDETPLTPVYDPTHPDANEDGYYYLPNVDVEEEQMDAIAAINSYVANLTIFNSAKTLAEKTLTIGQ